MKKFIFQIFTILLLVGTAAFNVSAAGELNLPSISKISGGARSFFFLPDGENLMVSVENGSGTDIGIIQASTGNMIRTLFHDDYGTSTIAANDQGTFYSSVYYGGISEFLTLYNEFGENIFNSDKIDYQGSQLEGFSHIAFLPQTNILLVTTYQSYGGTLFGYDVENKKVVFARQIPYDGPIIASADYIAIMGDSSALILDKNGNYVTTVEPGFAIKTMEFTSDGSQLVVGGDNSQPVIYDAKNDFNQVNLGANQFKLADGTGFKTIDIDPNNKFLVATTSNYGEFKMFDFQTGNPIVTNLDSDGIDDAKISKDGKYIVARDTYGYTYVFDGENLKKRVVKIDFPANQANVELGKPKSLMLKATLADGTSKDILTGISWATNNVSIAYIKSGKLIPVKQGSVNVKGKYLGFEVTAKVNILPDKTPPVIKGVKNLKIKLGKSFNPRSGVTAQDLVDGDLTKKITISGKVNTKKTGNYKLTYTVKDKAGNQQKAYQTVTVVK